MLKHGFAARVCLASVLTLWLSGAQAQSYDGPTMDVMYGMKCIRATLNEPLCACITKEARTRFADLVEREIFLDMISEGIHPAKNQLVPKLKSEQAFLSRLKPADQAVTVCKQRHG